MRFIKFARVIKRDYPDLFDALFERSDANKRKIRLKSRSVLALHITRDEFYDTVGVSDRVWNLTMSQRSDKMLGEFASTNRRMRQQLLVEYIRKNTDYVRLQLL